MVHTDTHTFGASQKDVVLKMTRHSTIEKAAHSRLMHMGIIYYTFEMKAVDEGSTTYLGTIQKRGQKRPKDTVRF